MFKKIEVTEEKIFIGRADTFREVFLDLGVIRAYRNISSYSAERLWCHTQAGEFWVIKCNRYGIVLFWCPDYFWKKNDNS